MELTKDQMKKLGIIDNRVDFYFKMENDIVDRARELKFNSYEGWLVTILSRYCNNNNVAFPSLETLRELMYCSKNTVIKTIKSLEKKEVIKKVKRSGINGNQSNLYSVQNVNEVLKSMNKEETDLVHEVNYPSSRNEPPLVHEVNHPSARGEHNKELSKKNYSKKNYLRTNTNQSVDKSSSAKTKKPFIFHNYKFLQNMEDISLATRINIELKLKDMKLTKEFVMENLEYIKNDKKIKDIEATLYSSLKKCVRYNATNFARTKEQESINNKKNDTVNKDIINTIVETPKVNLRQNIIMKHMKLNKMKLGVKALRQLNIELKENNLEMHELS